MSTIRSPFSGRLITCNFSSVMTAFRRFLTGIILGDEDLHFPRILGTNAYAFKWGDTSAT
jgi:hypothetical protein